MKKTVKGFCTSFALSSFAIWVASEVFSSVVPTQQNEIKIPQKNIALFFQKSDFAPHPIVTKQVATADLAKLKTVTKDENALSKEEIAALTTNVSEPIKIASIEDVADIPIEQDAVAKSNEIIYQEPTLEKTAPAKIASRSPLPPITQENPKAKDEKKENENIIKIADASLDASLNKNPEIILPPIVSSVDEEETDIIPLEKAPIKSKAENVEVVDSAPQTQVAAVDKQISIDAMSIEVNDTVEEPKQREWQEMSEINDDPWVVAKANKFAKNSKAVEDYAADEDEAKIEEMLAPTKMEDEGKETQTARVAKNLLIPIPEDILNDENLTPQLVSPKKNLVKRDDTDSDEDVIIEDVPDEETPKNKKGVWEKITSIFSSDDEDNTDVSINSDTITSGKKKIRKSFSDAGENPSKILPAEMRLSFQPGRAEISGQTLRWVQAFANKAATSPNIILEVRIDKNSSYALQQRRLDLLNTILSRSGIDESKVNTVFTSREPNSFIIRTLRINDGTQRKMKNNIQPKSVYQTW